MSMTFSLIHTDIFRGNMMHDRRSDEELLILFVENQEFDIPELVAATVRLKMCHENGLDDYGVK